MSFAIHTFRRRPPWAGPDHVPAGLGGRPRAVVWPALGFNCLHWRLPHGSDRLDLLYVDPALYGNGKPTRSGIPVLFPFPNRIRAGRFSWDGKEYQLPLNDPARRTPSTVSLCTIPGASWTRGPAATALVDGRVPVQQGRPGGLEDCGRPTIGCA